MQICINDKLCINYDQSFNQNKVNNKFQTKLPNNIDNETCEKQKKCLSAPVQIAATECCTKTAKTKPPSGLLLSHFVNSTRFENIHMLFRLGLLKIIQEHHIFPKHIQVFTAPWGGGGGKGYPIQLTGGGMYYLSRSRWGVPPSQVQVGGVPHSQVQAGGYPLPRSRGVQVPSCPGQIPG